MFKKEAYQLTRNIIQVHVGSTWRLRTKTWRKHIWFPSYKDSVNHTIITNYKRLVLIMPPFTINQKLKLLRKKPKYFSDRNRHAFCSKDYICIHMTQHIDEQRYTELSFMHSPTLQLVHNTLRIEKQS